jgi:hypothetical protein
MTEELRGGYQVIATAFNETFEFPDGRGDIDRRQVEMWFVRQTRNKDGNRPPLPVNENPEAAHSQPYYEFDVPPWIDWAAAGVPGRSRKGWVIPVRKGTDTMPEHSYYGAG